MSSRETGQADRGADAPGGSGRTSAEVGRSAERDSESWAGADVAGRGDTAPDSGATSPASASSPDGAESWAKSPSDDHQQRIDDARAEVDRAYRITEARVEVDRAYAETTASRAEASWASVAERPAPDAERTEPSDATSESAAQWQPHEIRDNDWDGLRQLERDGSRFSEHRMMWIAVDDPRLESSEHVRGETFKGGVVTDSYKRDVAALYARRDELTEIDHVDPRHTGDERIRIEESEDGGLTITNGYHRVQAAREAGIPAVLADAIAFRGDHRRDR